MFFFVLNVDVYEVILVCFFSLNPKKKQIYVAEKFKKILLCLKIFVLLFSCIHLKVCMLKVI